MPIGVNNVDLSVTANTLFGITSLLLQVDLETAAEYFDEEIAQIYSDSTDLLVYAINAGYIQNRPDLALTYYPSEYDFYWFVARTYMLLKKNKDNLPFF